MPMIRYIGISVASKNTYNKIPSSALNTPIIRPDRIRNAPMYWFTRSVMACQEAITTITVVKAVSGTNQNEMPSTPRWSCTLKRSIQAVFSTNCIAAVPGWKPWYRGSVTSKPSTAPSRASQRTEWACSSRPMASSTTPKATGIQMARLNRPIFLLLLLVEPDEVRHQDEDTQDHHQRVVMDEARLQPAHHACDRAHQFPGPVDQHPVDDGLIAALPQTAPQCPGRAGQDALVEPVEVILVFQQAVERQDPGLDRSGQRRTEQVHVVRQRNPGQCQPERRCLQAMPGHGPGAVELPGQICHRRVLGGIANDRIAKKVAEQHRPDEDEPCQHRRKRQQHQGQRHHPRGLVRRRVCSMA